VAEPWQSYANLVGDLTRNVRERAMSTARLLLTQAGLEERAMDAGERLSKLVEEIWQASRANRELVENLIAAEVDRAAGRLGLVRSEELQELRAEVAELRESIRTTPQPAGRARKSPGKRAPAKKAAMKKAAETAVETSAAAG
jgi:Poly(hydroxyalcanoate) granule associated protein (phasin)